MRSSLKRGLIVSTAAAALAAGAVAATGRASGEAASPPRPTSPPTITGVSVGQTLTAAPGTWTGTGPIQYLYQWIRSDTGDGTPIKGATASTYKPTADDIGHNLFVQIKAINSTGYDWSNSKWTSRVMGPTQADAVKLADGRTSVLVDHVALPNRLVVAASTSTPTRLRANGSVVVRVSVVDSMQHPVRGALVQLTGLPFGAILPPAETPTDANGVATIAVKGRPQVLKHVPGGAMALLVRARKPGDDVLTGVTAERLVKLDISH